MNKFYNSNILPTVLIVDDQVNNLEILFNILKNNDINILKAEGGQQALDIVQTFLPDLILLDIMMPVMNGFQVCAKLKENKRTRDIPIVFLTALTQSEEIVKGFQLGGVDYITKPFKREELIKRIETHIMLKRSKDKIVEQCANLEFLNKEKDKILSIAIHDLKNPIQVIIGFAKMLENMFDDFTKDEIIETAKDIVESGYSMDRTISNLITIIKAEQNKLEIILDKFDVNKCISGIIDKFRNKIFEKSLIINFERNPEEILIESDLAKVHEILENLISNAVKFSFNNRNLYIRSIITTDAGNQDFVRLEIKDEGPGFMKKDLKKLSSKFSKSSVISEEIINAGGLGLTVVKILVDMMNGKISCESEFDKGSNFIIELPLKPVKG